MTEPPTTSHLKDIPEAKDDWVSGIDVSGVEGVIHHHVEHHMDVCQVGVAGDVEVPSLEVLWDWWGRLGKKGGMS